MSGPVHQPDESLQSDVLLTIAICTRNRMGFLEKAVASVLDQMIPCVELLIIDNASTDQTAQFAKQLAASNSVVRYVREDELGLSAARNTALKEAKGTFVLFLDDDAVAKTGWVKNYFSFLSVHRKDRVGVVGGPVFPAYESNPPTWVAPHWNLLDYGGETRELRDGGSPWGGNSAFNKAATLAIGAFNPKLGRRGNFSGAFEESDVIQRLRDSGWQIWWLADAGIDHFIPLRRVAFKALLRERFHGGRSSALIRLQAKPSSAQRNSYRLLRLFGQPFECLCTGLAAGFVFVLGHRARAVHLALKCARGAGFGYQLLQSENS